MDDGFSRRDVAILLASMLGLFVLGTLLFMWTLGESWHAALYRTIVTASLVGLDSTPHGLKAEAVTILIVLCGVASFGYFAAQLFDEIARGGFGGGWWEKRRRQLVDDV